MVHAKSLLFCDNEGTLINVKKCGLKIKFEFETVSLYQ